MQGKSGVWESDFERKESFLPKEGLHLPSQPPSLLSGNAFSPQVLAAAGSWREAAGRGRKSAFALGNIHQVRTHPKGEGGVM